MAGGSTAYSMAPMCGIHTENKADGFPICRAKPVASSNSGNLVHTLALSRSPDKELCRSQVPSCCPIRAHKLIHGPLITESRVQSQPRHKLHQENRQLQRPPYSLTGTENQASSSIHLFSARGTSLNPHPQCM